MNNFPVEKINKLKKAIDRALQDDATPIAAFDADGTLWATDMGEKFFDYQITERLLGNLPDDPWAYYRALHHKSEPDAFLWLAQINKGLPIETVRKWAHQSFANMDPLPIFSWVKEIVKHLQSSGVEIFIVTASIKWSVEPGAEYLGIPAENVIGVKTAIENGIVTDSLDGVVTWREGKVTGLLNATGKRTPFFSAGNTMGDLALLDSATHIRLVNCSASANEPNYETEKKLLEIAKTKCWFHHQY